MRIGGSLRSLGLAGALALGFFGVVPVAVRLLVGSSLTAMLVAIALSLSGYLPMVWLRRDVLGIRVLIEALSPRKRTA
jgi:uncharacterized membrane protein YqaE (UPF0057 family)